MNDFENQIVKALKTEIDKPLQYEYAIKNAFHKNKVKIYKNSFLKVLATSGCLIMGCTCVMATSYVIYEKVWKEPKEYSSYSEYVEDTTKISSLNSQNANDVLNENEILKLATNLTKNLKYENTNISLFDITKNDLYPNCYTIFKDNIEIMYNLDGSLHSFVDTTNSNNYNISQDNISKENAISFAEEIKNKLNLKEKYKLNKINEITSFSEDNNEKKVWYAKFNQYNNEINNPNIYLDMYFYVEDNSAKIEEILFFNNMVQYGYDYDNNEVKISKDDALKIALDKDKEISNLEIKTTDISLEVRDMNAFVYSQENSNGLSDEISYFESGEDNSIVAYDKYEDSKLLRNVWNVKVVYEIESENNVKTWKENFGRNYYIDVTTGEIIGGSWGENWNNQN